MPQRWSLDQIAALAPDGVSLAAARKLTTRWSDTGHHQTALWGSCQGSAAKPYQTIVDLSGPAYTCSCPSRKFPCKHALSLLVSWAEDAVPDRDSAPDQVTEWLATRAERAAPAARTPNPQTAVQRRERVSAGLEDLDRWLQDQVRTGLAQANRGYAEFDAIAARMVDAQAPALARRLRKLPYVVATEPDWPQRLLIEYAQIRLLIKAHRRLDTLDPALRASVQAHIGYPVSTQSVQELPAHRDSWMVLGLRVSEDNELYSRHVWLRGRASRRWALLLDFSYGTPAFDAVPQPGQLLDADLHYYPGAVPMRAVLGTRHAVAEPFTALPGAGFDAALDDYAAAVGADPWLRSYPAVLEAVVPTAQRRLVDGHGRQLPLDSNNPWPLLGISGGHPVTVVGEVSARGVEPVSVVTAGETWPV